MVEITQPLVGASSPDAIPAPEGATNVIQTDYEIGQDNISYRRRFVLELDIHNVVFTVSALGIMAFTILTLMFQTTLEPVFTSLRDVLTSNLDGKAFAERLGVRMADRLREQR